MATQKAKFYVGLFVTGGITIATLSIVWLGMSRYLRKGKNYVTYFNESVQGLDIDSPVKYRGVPIGRVEKIEVAPDSKLIQVILQIESNEKLDRSIVAQLNSVGITGSVFVELDRKKENEPDQSPSVNFPLKYPRIASKPSEISELMQGINDALSQIKSLDLRGISDKAKLALDRVNTLKLPDLEGMSNKGKGVLDKISRAIDDANIPGIATRMESSLQGVDRILGDERWNKILTSAEQGGASFQRLMDDAGKGLNEIVEENRENLHAAVAGFRDAIKDSRALLQDIAQLTRGTDKTVSRLRRHLLTTTRNLEKSSENLDRMMEILSHQPSQLLFGQPPRPRDLGPQD